MLNLLQGVNISDSFTKKTVKLEFERFELALLNFQLELEVRVSNRSLICNLNSKTLRKHKEHKD